MGPWRDLLELLCLKRLDVLDAVGDATTELQVRRPQSLPSPSFEGAGAELPASGELNLAQMSGADGRTLLRGLPGRVGRMIHCPG